MISATKKPVARIRKRQPRLRMSRPHLQPFPPMIRWALTFLVLGLIAALFGFTSIAGAAIGIAKILFYVFLVLFGVALLVGMTAGGGRAPR
jgi:uncharacterized membrane protein YtjA (UPF0391 family)